MGTPAVSIVVPTLGQADTIPETLASIFAGRTVPQVVVMHGGLPDGTAEAVAPFRDRIQFRSEPDAGQADAIAKGFVRSAADVLAWINSDDLYYPGAVDRALEVLREDPAIDVYYGHGVLLTREGHWLSWFDHTEPFSAWRLCNFSAYILQPTVFFRRRALEAVGGLDRGLRYAMDYDLLCRLASNGARFHFDRELVAAARLHPGTKTGRGGLARFREIVAVSRRHGGGILPPLVPRLAAAELLERAGAAGSLLRRLYWGPGGIPEDWWWSGPRVARIPYFRRPPAGCRVTLIGHQGNGQAADVEVGGPAGPRTAVRLTPGARATVTCAASRGDGELAVAIHASDGRLRYRVQTLEPWSPPPSAPA